MKKTLLLAGVTLLSWAAAAFLESACRGFMDYFLLATLITAVFVSHVLTQAARDVANLDPEPEAVAVVQVKTLKPDRLTESTGPRHSARQGDI